MSGEIYLFLLVFFSTAILLAIVIGCYLTKRSIDYIERGDD